tara:strand:+ start:2447 stop:2623 length:177 start_codon:yes stop_codon:yes gene_type:complete
MNKNLKPDEVIGMIQKKVLLKKELKDMKSNGEDKKAEVVSLKIEQIDEKLHSRPLSKN